jgi:anti-sigma factor RsiW
MQCRETNKLIHDFIDGALGSAARSKFEGHVATCADCTETLHRYQTLTIGLDQMERAEVPAGFADRVMVRLKVAGAMRDRRRAAAPGRAGIFGWLHPRLRIPLTMAAVLIVALSIFSSTSGMLHGFVGKSAVFVTDASLEIQERLSAVEVVTQFVRGIFGSLATLIKIAFSVLTTAGEVFRLPALAMIVMMTVGVVWYLRSHQSRRRAHHASYSF